MVEASKASSSRVETNVTKRSHLQIPKFAELWACWYLLSLTVPAQQQHIWPWKGNSLYKNVEGGELAGAYKQPIFLCKFDSE
jgi:hypothetical protein